MEVWMPILQPSGNYHLLRKYRRKLRSHSLQPFLSALVSGGLKTSNNSKLNRSRPGSDVFSCRVTLATQKMSEMIQTPTGDDIASLLTFYPPFQIFLVEESRLSHQSAGLFHLFPDVP